MNHISYLTIFSLCLYLCTCISPSYTKFPHSSMDCNIVARDILQTRPRWIHESQVMLTILPYRRLTYLQHPDTIDYREYTCFLPVDIPHTEIHNCLWSMTNSVWTLETQLSHIEFCRFSMLHQFYGVRWPQMLEHLHIITSYRGVICRGAHSHSGYQFSIWPAPWVS